MVSKNNKILLKSVLFETNHTPFILNPYLYLAPVFFLLELNALRMCGQLVYSALNLGLEFSLLFIAD